MKVVVQPQRPQLWRRIPPVYVILVVITVVAWILWNFTDGSFFGKENIANILQRSVSLECLGRSNVYHLGGIVGFVGCEHDIGFRCHVFLYHAGGSEPRTFCHRHGCADWRHCRPRQRTIDHATPGEPAHQHVGHGPLLQGILSASFRNFAALCTRTVSSARLWFHRPDLLLGADVYHHRRHRGFHSAQDALWCTSVRSRRQPRSEPTFGAFAPPACCWSSCHCQFDCGDHRHLSRKPLGGGRPLGRP